MTDAEKTRVLNVLQYTISYTGDRDTTGPLKSYAKNERVWSRSGMMSHVRELERKLRLVTEANQALLDDLKQSH